MGWLSAAFFTWVQGATFYIDAHAKAVALLPPGQGKSWLDVGCGPGLVARLASRRGYAVTGIDMDKSMIRAARYQARGLAQCRFDTADLAALAETEHVDVVSAASLLFVLSDPAIGLNQLWQCVKPNGILLVVETTEKMTPAAAKNLRHALPRGRRRVLDIWAKARDGKALNPSVFAALPAQTIRQVPLLDGMLCAWLLSKV